MERSSCLGAVAPFQRIASRNRLGPHPVVIDAKPRFPPQSERRLVEKPVEPSHAVGREGDVLESAQQQEIEGTAGEPFHITPVAEEGARSRAAHELVEGVAVELQSRARPELHDPAVAGAFEQRPQFAQFDAALAPAQLDMAGPAVEQKVEDRMTPELRSSPLTQPKLQLRTGGDAKGAVIEVSRDLDGCLTEPLEIAVGDRLRIGATQWEKQLFNGTVVTVEDLEVRPAEAAAVSRKARNRQAGGHTAKPDSGASESEYSVQITARTDDGRRVTFRHDEIRDWHDNIRLDYGYAMTIASAQGLTVDRPFLLVDDRPARETIYPAATRHREALDVYVNRAPLAFDIAEHRPEDKADMPVLDSDVRAYLAERWSRSQPKEAALDYVSNGMWRDAREDGRAASRARWRRYAAGDDRGLCRCERQRDRPHRSGNPPCGQRLAPRRGGGCLRGRAHRRSGGVGRAA